MGKLNASLILPSVVNGGRYLSNSRSSFSSSVNPFATHMDALNKKPMSGEIDKHEDAFKLFQAMQNSKLELGIVSYNIVIDGLCKAGHIEVAKELFRELAFNGLKPNVYTYTIMINGLCKERLPDEAHELFRSMRDDDCLPNGCHYNVMIQGFLRNKYTLEATQLVAEMVGKGFFADICTATLFVNHILASDKSILI
ncbi:hypothetical protein V6N13_012994 [Hibiscus sabdariffa]